MTVSPATTKNTFFDLKSNFRENLNSISMTFINPDYEDSYQKYKYGKKNFLVIIGINLLANIGLLTIRGVSSILDAWLNSSTELRINSSFMIFLTIIMALMVGFEILSFFILKMKLFRGFSLSISLTAGTVYMSQNYSYTMFLTSSPVLVPSSIFVIITVIIGAFLYSSNWICGSLQIFIMIGGFDYFLLSFPCNWFNDKPFWLACSISTCISLILCIYYFEYFQRKSVFRRIESDNQRKAKRNSSSNS